MAAGRVGESLGKPPRFYGIRLSEKAAPGDASEDSVATNDTLERARVVLSALAGGKCQGGRMMQTRPFGPTE